jgi:serine/threonine protein kinase
MIGNVVGSYKITEKIGEGGMGAVFKGVDLMLEREVAIKMLRPELASQPQVLERFRAEAVTLAKLNHPNVATLHSFFRQGDDFFMVMEFVRGQSLEAIIHRSGAMTCERAIALFCQALEGIGRAHKLGIIHRDIKPANIMLTEEGSVKVMDFGIARVLGTSRMTKQGNIVGTIEYMSPEAIQGEEADARSDIYSLGILLYEMLTGRVPFMKDTEFSLMMAQIQEAPPPPRTFASHIPAEIEQAIMRSLAKKPEARFQTVGEFREALEKSIGAANFAAPKSVPLPATRITESPVIAPGAQMKQTKLASDAQTSPAALESQLKETRLGQAGIVQPAFAPNMPPQMAQSAAPQSSFASKLNWMHYAGAAVLVVALIGVPFALMSGGKKEAPPPAATQPVVTQPTAVQPATTQPAPSMPATTPAVEQAPIPQPAQSASPPNPLGGENKLPAINVTDDKQAGKATAGAAKPPKPARREDDAAARERERRRAEAKRLLDQ